MRLGLTVGYPVEVRTAARAILEAERLGFDSV
jgi:hypothetical protein